MTLFMTENWRTGDFHHLVVNPLEKSGKIFLKHRLRCLSEASADEGDSLFITHCKRSPYSLHMVKASSSDCLRTFSLSSLCSSWCNFPSWIKNNESNEGFAVLFFFMSSLIFSFKFHFFKNENSLKASGTWEEYLSFTAISCLSVCMWLI